MENVKTYSEIFKVVEHFLSDRVSDLNVIGPCEDLDPWVI